MPSHSPALALEQGLQTLSWDREAAAWPHWLPRLTPLGPHLLSFQLSPSVLPLLLCPFLLVAAPLGKCNSSGTLASFPETSLVCASWRGSSFRRPELVQALTILQPLEPSHMSTHSAIFWQDPHLTAHAKFQEDWGAISGCSLGKNLCVRVCLCTRVCMPVSF